MKKILVVIILAGISLAGWSQSPVLPYKTGIWNPDSLGNQRVVVRVDKAAPAVLCEIPWRRRDLNPQDKEILVYAQKGNLPVKNVIRLEVGRESGKLVFEPVVGAGDYYFYYLPYKSSGGNYPKVTYLKPVDRCDAGWKANSGQSSGLPKALAVEMQSINDLNSFYPMEVIATKKETNQYLAKTKGAAMVLFPEYRGFPIRMWNDLPYRWIQRGLSDKLSDTIQRGAYYSFQIGVLAVSDTLKDLQVKFSDLTGPGGASIPASRLTCFNMGGNDWNQEPLVKKVSVPKGKIQPLWIGVDIAKDLEPGVFRGTVEIAGHLVETGGRPSLQKIRLELTVLPGILSDRGDSKPEMHSRLRWLNSDIAVDDGVIPPYTPIEVSGQTLKILGRDLKLGNNGLPEQVTSYFTPAMTAIQAGGEPLLTEPMAFEIEINGKANEVKSTGMKFTGKAEGGVDWESNWTAGDLEFHLVGRLEFDGFLTYRITAKAKKNTEVSDIEFVIPMNGDRIQYMLGLGQKGGKAPDQFNYKWDPYFNCDGPWLGSVNAGIQATFRAENYERPLNTNFYHQKPLNMPPSWYNGGKGGIELDRTGKEYELTAYTGDRTIKIGETLHFDINLLLTPFRTINPAKQWHDRYYHKYMPLDTIAKAGGNVVNVHHATGINPFINYPFMRPAGMKAYIDSAHAMKDKVKIYYTVRELSNICPEIWALKSLGNEVLSYGPGGGYSWLQEHLDGNYIPAWFVPDYRDAAVINSGTSRWHNYYLEGLNWLVKNVGIDGLYIDDVAFDRSIMKRAKKVLLRGNPDAMIDLHSANQFNERDGYTNSGNLYLEHFPYLDRLWFGEYFDYNGSPDYWMTEVAGIPFGLMGEMLQDGGNQWRGLIYGMTSRAPWSGDPSNIWKLVDDFGIQKAEMIGYWSLDCPVKTGRPDILATVYKAQGKTMIAIASWAAGPARISLDIDWKSLGIDPSKAKMTLPAVKKFQEAGELKVGESFTVPSGKGLSIIVTGGQ
ncbi:MAG: glycoside hydrolase domain-containing protein [Bacteroidales bacterium]